MVNEKDNKCKEIIFDVALYIIAAAFAILVGIISLGKGLDLSLAQSFDGDGSLMLAIFNGIQENGIEGIFFNPRLGAPDIASFIDFPVFDILSSSIVWVISLFSESASSSLYVYYVITFALNAIAMVALLKKLSFSRYVCFSVGLIFTFMPYHFLRGLGHVNLITYIGIPIAIYLSLCMIGYFEEEKKRNIIFWSAILGLGFGYYYAFGLILMSVAVIMRFCREPRLGKLKTYVWIPCVTLGFVFISLLPKLIYALINGPNELVGQRSPLEQEVYGLKIIQLLMPPSYTRFGKLGELVGLYSTHAPLVNENATAALGAVGSIGFALLCAALLYSFCTKDRCKGKMWDLIDFLSLSVLVFVTVGAIGGFGLVFNFLVTPQIRCYNRSSIFIAGLALVMVALVIDKITVSKSWGKCIICLAILGVSMYDTVYIHPDYWQEALRPTQEIYEDYFANVEASLDEGDMVYQLPYLDFPEVGPFDYKHFNAYLYTDTLRWSYGGVKGRDTGARELLDSDGGSYMFLKNIKNAGFKAVYIDTDGYEDGGASILSFYNGLGVEPLVSSDGKLYLYDIRNINVDLL